MEGCNAHEGIDLYLAQDQPSEHIRNILETPDLGRKVVIQDLDDPPIAFLEHHGSDSLLGHGTSASSLF